MPGAGKVVPRGDVRRAVQADALAVAGVWLRSRHDPSSLIPSPVHSDDAVRAWFAAVVVPERETWVIEENGAIVGLLVLEPGWVDQLYVDPRFTSRGFGSALLDLAKERNVGGLDLWTFEMNTGARRFYERHGFVAVETTAGENEEGAPAVRYRWPGR